MDWEYNELKSLFGSKVLVELSSSMEFVEEGFLIGLVIGGDLYL